MLQRNLIKEFITKQLNQNLTLRGSDYQIIVSSHLQEQNLKGQFYIIMEILHIKAEIFG